MNLNQAKDEAIAKAKQGEAYSVCYDDHRKGEFIAIPTAKLGDRFPHFHGHAWLPSKKVTFCVASYNDDSRLDDTLHDLMLKVDRDSVSVVVCIDGPVGRNPYRYKFPEVTFIYNGSRLGVGYSLDRAVDAAMTDLVCLMGADVRFSETGWLEPFLAKVQARPEAIICVQCGKLNPERKFVYPEMHCYTGAGTLLRHPKSKHEFRQYLEAEWTQVQGEGLHQIGCVLGAFYGCTRQWYQHIRGFEGHKEWGTLEPLISLRSYLMGGECLIDMDTKVGHIFITDGSGSQKNTVKLIHNKLLLADTLLKGEIRQEVIDWVGRITYGQLALNMWEQNEKREELKAYFEKPLRSSAYGRRLRQSFKDLG